MFEVFQSLIVINLVYDQIINFWPVEVYASWFLCPFYMTLVNTDIFPDLI